MQSSGRPQQKQFTGDTKAPAKNEPSEPEKLQSQTSFTALHASKSGGGTENNRSLTTYSVSPLGPVTDEDTQPTEQKARLDPLAARPTPNPGLARGATDESVRLPTRDWKAPPAPESKTKTPERIDGTKGTAFVDGRASDLMAVLPLLANPDETGSSLIMSVDGSNPTTATMLAHAINQNNALTKLTISLSAENDPADVFAALSDAWKSNKNIIHLEFNFYPSSGRVVGNGDSYSYIGTMLLNQPLQNLVINGLWAGLPRDDDRVNANFGHFCAAAAKSATLRGLTLGRGCLHSKNIHGIGEMLAQTKTLQTLNLSGAAFYDEPYDEDATPVSILGRSLAHNTSLLELDLSNNDLDDDCMAEIVHSFDPSFLTNATVRGLFYALKAPRNETLQRLDLRGSLLTTEGAKRLLQIPRVKDGSLFIKFSSNFNGAVAPQINVANELQSRDVVEGEVGQTADLSPDVMRVTAGYIDNTWKDSGEK